MIVGKAAFPWSISMYYAMDKTSSVSLLFIILIFFSNSCSSPGEEQVVSEQLEPVHISPDIILEIKKTDDHLFGRLSSLDVDSEGRVYVFDSQARNERVFDRDGSLLHTIGRKGSGPGEFESLRSISVDDKSTVWIYDNSKLGISSFSMQTDTTWEFQSHIIIPDAKEGFPMAVYKFKEGFIVGYMKRIREKTQQQMEITLSHMNHKGELVNEEILTYVEEEAIVPDSESEFIPIYPIPFNWRTHARGENSGNIHSENRIVCASENIT